ncbi:MAG: hypothetical protein Q7T96_09925 [Methylobacter sp.]|nr:hypothetical protein [Methylobacter sp.]
MAVVIENGRDGGATPVPLGYFCESAGSQSPDWEPGKRSSSFAGQEATTAWMQEVEQRRSGCRELPLLNSQAGAWELAEYGTQRVRHGIPTQRVGTRVFTLRTQ